MTAYEMSCSRADALLAGYLEGELSQRDAELFDAHVESCARCLAQLGEIEMIRTAAAKLPAVEPSRDLWEGIEGRIGARVMDMEQHRARPSRGIVVSPRLLAIAASLLVMATAGVTYTLLRGAAAGPATVATRPVDPATSPAGLAARPVSFTVTGEFGAYTEEIDDLQGAISERRSRLDPATIATIERNLKVIDAAIAESKRALERDPASRLLSDRLSGALESKIQLLRQAALLPPLT